MIVAIFRESAVRNILIRHKALYIICFATEKHNYNKEGFHSDLRNKNLKK